MYVVRTRRQSRFDAPLLACTSSRLAGGRDRGRSAAAAPLRRGGAPLGAGDRSPSGHATDPGRRRHLWAVPPRGGPQCRLWRALGGAHVHGSPERRRDRPIRAALLLGPGQRDRGAAGLLLRRQRRDRERPDGHPPSRAPPRAAAGSTARPAGGGAVPARARADADPGEGAVQPLRRAAYLRGRRPADRAWAVGPGRQRGRRRVVRPGGRPARGAPIGRLPDRPAFRPPGRRRGTGAGGTADAALGRHRIEERVRSAPSRAAASADEPGGRDGRAPGRPGTRPGSPVLLVLDDEAVHGRGGGVAGRAGRPRRARARAGPALRGRADGAPGGGSERRAPPPAGGGERAARLSSRAGPQAGGSRPPAGPGPGGRLCHPSAGARRQHGQRGRGTRSGLAPAVAARRCARRAAEVRDRRPWPAASAGRSPPGWRRSHSGGSRRRPPKERSCCER